MTIDSHVSDKFTLSISKFSNDLIRGMSEMSKPWSLMLAALLNLK